MTTKPKKAARKKNAKQRMEKPSALGSGSRAQQPANPRAEAVKILTAILEGGRNLDAALAGNRNLDRLSQRDRAFARLLVTTLLRRMGQIDAAIKACLDRPLKQRDTQLRNLLRLGTAQILFLKTPPHAAVSTTLDLAKGPRLSSFKGLLNAVLRRLAREGRELIAGQEAERLNTPRWLWETWCAAYGEETTRAMAAVHAGEPPLDVTVKEDPAAWAERLGATMSGGKSLRLPKGQGDVAKLPGYGEGAWWVQDYAASLPARLLGDVAGQAVFDLCAAPGGKTAQLAAAGAEVTAVDSSAERMARLKDNLTRLDLGAGTAIADVLTWEPPGPADAVLLDCPCSSTGTLRRHPDVARLKKRDQVEALSAIQDQLLQKAIQFVKPGGLLIFATCSLQPEEGPERIGALLQRESAMARVPVEAEEMDGLTGAITAEGDLRTLPSLRGAEGGMDGFYACRLTRRTA